ncbi:MULTISPECIES: HigA family addiction module antitoxin [unclassified Tolypothrix]|uniref:HigA family addiction module antitoxin n=1 Tax=unclassified Tolypothrix TaxID=2649714 RepID=UPI0005EAC833|nr:MULTISPECIES: HigA family addiction module antitoxin [unclassified Tolypothrix]BAY91435.1 plasmid maintenance system antidote protein [Microchaete diplosiphon NIES-3275]EKF05525.1 putative XRE family transcriptional regulator [Tolypothrix sp. PCC 7601]MBE9086015.1 HigA family addiction module antidote protein [Tolypothrix sp. LEGE 11397]UYD25473.1 HigA family addiction module antidote protein [Tolypothrix sp. PCC 7712]UYD32286.1 HigA family addiction module antidote protein [Tolypothrix sp.
MIKTTRPFTPDWVSPPGDTIADFLEERDWTQVQLAERLGYTTKHISQLINGKAPINEETAMKLERVLGSTAAFWLNREAQYRAALARIEEENRLKGWTSWLDQLPVKELMNQGVIPKCNLIAKNKPSLVKKLLHFFGVASPDEWRSYYAGMEIFFRRTRDEQSDVAAISAWLRLGEIEAEKLDCPKYSKPKFEKVVREIRSLTVLPPDEFEPQMQQLCREAGVVLVLVPAIKRAHVSGVARWLNPHKALIQLSLYGKTNDRFWFNFFHEAAHILLHDKENIFLDEWDGGESLASEPEREANQWSREILIPPQYDRELAQLKSKADVVDFAERIGIHPAIVVGRLQHDCIIPISWMNGLKESLCFQGVE